MIATLTVFFILGLAGGLVLVRTLANSVHLGWGLGPARPRVACSRCGFLQTAPGERRNYVRTVGPVPAGTEGCRRCGNFFVRGVFVRHRPPGLLALIAGREVRTGAVWDPVNGFPHDPGLVAPPAPQPPPVAEA